MQAVQLVMNYNRKVTTTSKLIADAFEKRHDNVLRDIQNLECSDEFRLLNFEESSYINSQGKKMPFYFITRDGFTLLVMSFTGTKATKFKEAFIKQFNLMEEALRNQEKERTPNLIPTYQQRILSEPTKSCPDDRWNIFDQSHEIMLFVEKHIGSVNKFDLVDGSIGRLWSIYRRDKKWATVVTQYYHHYKDKRGKQLSNCYDYSELKYFKIWLKNDYKLYHLGDYLINKFKKEKNTRLLEKANNLMPTMHKKAS